MNKKVTKFSPEVRERAVRLVRELRSEHPSMWAVVESIAPMIGCTPQTLTASDSPHHRASPYERNRDNEAGNQQNASDHILMALDSHRAEHAKQRIEYGVAAFTV
jgi:transposase